MTAYGLMMTDTYPKWGSGVPAVGTSPGSRRRSGAAGARHRATGTRYLRNLLVVLSASTLPPVWHVGQ